MKVLGIIVAALIAYFLGTIPMGEWVARLYGKDDLTKTGSGNPGTTNVLRTMGWLPSLMTLAGDCLKGVLGAWLGRVFGGQLGMLVAGFCAVLGHDFPVFRGFNGGKGIATSLGVTCVICPLVAPILVGIVCILMPLTKMMSVGTLAATLTYPLWMCLLRPDDLPLTAALIFSLAVMSLSFIRHRANLHRLSRGEENKLDFGKIAKLSEKYKSFKKRDKGDSND